MPVPLHNQPVPTTIRRKPIRQLTRHILRARQPQPQPTLLISLITRQSRIRSLTHTAKAHTSRLPLTIHSSPLITAPHLIATIPQPRAIKLPLTTARQRLTHRQTTHKKLRVITVLSQRRQHIRSSKLPHTRKILPIPTLHRKLRISLNRPQILHTAHHAAPLKPVHTLTLSKIVRVTPRIIQPIHIHISRKLLLTHPIAQHLLTLHRHHITRTTSLKPRHHTHTATQISPSLKRLSLLQPKTRPQPILPLRQLIHSLSTIKSHIIHHTSATRLHRQHHRPLPALIIIPPRQPLKLHPLQRPRSLTIPAQHQRPHPAARQHQQRIQLHRAHIRPQPKLRSPIHTTHKTRHLHTLHIQHTHHLHPQLHHKAATGPGIRIPVPHKPLRTSLSHTQPTHTAPPLHTTHLAHLPILQHPAPAHVSIHIAPCRHLRAQLAPIKTCSRLHKINQPVKLHPKPAPPSAA